MTIPNSENSSASATLRHNTSFAQNAAEEIMETRKLRFGIVGPGMIAGVIADAIAKSKNAKLTAVSSRRLDRAQSFVTKRPGVAAIQGLDGLLSRSDVDAVYVATPTTAKEEIALAAITAGKHVIVEKPFVSRASLLRMTNAAALKGVAFMDATHFAHHPRTATIRFSTAEQIGSPRSLHTAFYFPFSDRTNIRFNVQQEPMGALGDLAWYSMRAIVEYLRPQGRIAKVSTFAERDPQTTAIVRASGLIAFETGEVSTFDAGYTAGTVLMDLQLVGTTGVIGIDDFVLDWADSWAFKNPDLRAGYSHRTAMATRKDMTFIPTRSNTAAEVLMIENFADLAATGNTARRTEFAESSLNTQEYLDASWTAACS
jgi:predicted dehydrogenase